MLLSIGEVAAVLGVSTSTLRRWEKEKKLLPSMRTVGGHRRYDPADISRMRYPQLQSVRKSFLYARVSGSDQKEDLERQVNRLQTYAEDRGWVAEVISDLGSGMKFKKRGLQRLLREVLDGQVERIVLTHRDRLMRFGFELISSICQRHGTEIIVLDELRGKSFEVDLTADIVEILTVFCARMHGRRSHQNRKKAA